MSQLLNRSVFIGAVVYGASFAAVGVLSVLGFFVFGMTGLLPGLLLVGEMILGVTLAALPVGWYAARGGLKAPREANLLFSLLSGVLSGVLAVGLPYLILQPIVLGIVSFSLNSTFIPLNLVPVGWFVICGLGGLGGALYALLGTRLDNARFYKWATVFAGGVVAFGILAILVVGMVDVQQTAERRPTLAATEAAARAEQEAYETSEAERKTNVRATLRAEQSVGMPASATAAANAHKSGSSPAPAAAWVMTESESFSDNQHGWHVGESKFTDGKTYQEFVEGKYRWSFTTNEHNFHATLSGWSSGENFQVTLTAQVVSRSVGCGYGIYLSPFSFVIRDSGEWALVDERNGEWSDVLKGKFDAIRPNQPNTVSVEGRGANYTFFVNDQWVGEVEVSNAYGSDAGLVVENVRAGTCVTDFDEFELRVSE